MPDELKGFYKGCGLTVSLTQIQSGEWTGKFILIRDDGPRIQYASYNGSIAFATREEATRAAFASARTAIEKLQDA